MNIGFVDQHDNKVLEIWYSIWYSTKIDKTRNIWLLVIVKPKIMYIHKLTNCIKQCQNSGEKTPTQHGFLSV